MVSRVGGFLAIVALLTFALDAAITAGLRRLPASPFGITNRIVEGTINANIVISGSSRAASHYDPRIIQKMTGEKAFNLGRNGSQTDMQLAVLKAYLKHNRKPAIVVHNLDAFTFQTTREVYNPAQYVPYLRENDLYQPLRKINPQIWKSRYLPLYGYVAEDMSFAWIRGLRAFLPGQQSNELIDGYDPRPAKWTEDFARYKTTLRAPVRWDIEPEGIRLMEDLVRVCREHGIGLIFVYSPEYREMQLLTANRTDVFAAFQRVASGVVPIWDYSAWPHANDSSYFNNSQHLNEIGATTFSTDFAKRLRQYLEARDPELRAAR
ncbi:MAG TPA: hypothetical protein VFQ91_28165 [Bryobacteraceae bacterium]|nr:hypothetical protein [Bryobacteraceae bacterium]